MGLFSPIKMSEEQLIEEAVRIKSKTETGSVTAALVDNYKEVVYANAANNYAYTIPPIADVAFPVGSWQEIRRTGTGDITITKGAGVTFAGVLGDVNVKIDGADGYSLFIRKTASDTWLLSGAIKAV